MPAVAMCPRPIRPGCSPTTSTPQRFPSTTRRKSSNPYCVRPCCPLAGAAFLTALERSYVETVGFSQTSPWQGARFRPWLGGGDIKHMVRNGCVCAGRCPRAGGAGGPAFGHGCRCGGVERDLPGHRTSQRGGAARRTPDHAVLAERAQARCSGEAFCVAWPVVWERPQERADRRHSRTADDGGGVIVRQRDRIATADGLVRGLARR